MFDVVPTTAERARLEALNDLGVRYLIVGMGAALIEGAREYELDGVRVKVLPLERVIVSKRAAKRPKDSAQMVDGTTLSAGPPVALFQTRIVGSGPNIELGRQYDVAPDGRFLINMATDEASASPITLILNWRAGVE